MQKEQAYDRRPAASIVVPSHNEASVLGKLLSALPTNLGDRPIEIIVACNGCTDDTAVVARQHGATVVEVAEPSKILALNAGDDVATAFPRIYIDADVVVNAKTIFSLIEALKEPGILCVAPPFHMELDGRPWVVRAYHQISLRIMQMKEGYVGSGVYAVSEVGRARFGRFPNIIADDTFVRNSYARTERKVVPTDATIVQAPWTLRALFRRRVRVCVGNMQLSQAEFQTLPGRAELPVSRWRLAMDRPLQIPGIFVYLFVNLVALQVARWRVRRKGPINWGRDNTTRITAS